jgi:ribosomal protein S8E
MEQQLNLHQFMINRMGMDGYAEWLLTPHTVKEIVSMKEASGLYKSPSIPGKATDMKMGSFIMGEKGGAFFLNLNGIKETTADKWFTRTYNRHTGTLTSGNVSEQGLIDSPRNESERSLMKGWNRSVANNMGLDEQANQAVLWYYEQSLYYNLGIKSARSESFSDGAKTLLNARGIPFTDAELAGARGRSNAGQVAAKPPSAGGTGDTVGLGQVAPAQPAATPTSVTGGRQAPQSGVK